jgi:hypothetical protein
MVGPSSDKNPDLTAVIEWILGYVLAVGDFMGRNFPSAGSARYGM